MTQMEIEQLTFEEYTYFLSYGELEQDNDSQLDYIVPQLLSNETCDSNDERELPQGSKNVCCTERYDRF